MFTTASTRRALRAAVLFVAAFGLLASPSRAAQTERCPGALDVPRTAEQLSDAAGVITCLVNAERTGRGLRPLRRDADLAQAARGHAADMAHRNFFAHVTPDGESLADRVRAAGYGEPGDGWRVGENLGWGTGGKAAPAALVDAWLASAPHKRILLEGEYRELGVGVATGAPVQTSSGQPGATYTLDVGVIRG